jgi:lipopolysaccharide/colanic/teichoic acid biosynthesis glycosyltransferase
MPDRFCFTPQSALFDCAARRYIHVDLKNPLWREVLAVRPGITDPIALRLRNEELLLASVDDRETFYREILLPYKLRGWAEYVRAKSLKTDLLILLRTVRVIALPSAAAPPSDEELSVAGFEQPL